VGTVEPCEISGSRRRGDVEGISSDNGDGSPEGGDVKEVLVEVLVGESDGIEEGCDETGPRVGINVGSGTVG